MLWRRSCAPWGVGKSIPRCARPARAPAARVIGAVVAAGLSLACASAQAPPGGPPDFTPPVILSTIPDSGTTDAGFRKAAVIQFDEVIDERSGGGLSKLISVSPVPKDVDVDWKRTAIAIKPKGGWHDSVVYQVALQPGIQDLRGNRMTTGRTIIFSTGGPIPDTRISGTVVDWAKGQLALRALVEAIRLPDSLRYVAATDSAANFTLVALPRGRYLVMAGVDANNDQRLEPREPLDSLTIELDSTASHTFWAFPHDTIGPGISRATLTDSVTIRLELNQPLPPGPPDSGSVRVLALPDSTPLAVANVWQLAQYDSITAAERASKPAPGADTSAAAKDTTQRAAQPARAAPVSPVSRAQARPDTAQARQAADTARVNALLRERPKIGSALVARMAAPLTAGARYVVETDLANLTGARRTSHQLLVVPEQRKP
jgi:hypothetical protein